jgi:hypothetical protein
MFSQQQGHVLGTLLKWYCHVLAMILIDILLQCACHDLAMDGQHMSRAWQEHGKGKARA